MLLEVTGLSKTFKNTKVLDDVNFSIDKGEVVSIVGQSGAGKTTTLRCVVGLEHGNFGTIKIADNYICKSVTDDNDENLVHRVGYPNIRFASKKQLNEIWKDLGMVFQSYHLFPHMTILQNVTLALTEVYKMPKDDAVSLAMQTLDSLGLIEKIDNKPFELSGGQKQRVAIARTIVTSPKLVCFDEPTAALDSGFSAELVSIIKKLAADEMGVLIISHDEKFVSQVSDRILFIEKGVITKDITASQFDEIIQ